MESFFGSVVLPDKQTKKLYYGNWKVVDAQQLSLKINLVFWVKKSSNKIAKIYFSYMPVYSLCKGIIEIMSYTVPQRSK